ncbi:MAG: DMT family transporter, partial [Pseudomonadota bacterium]
RAFGSIEAAHHDQGKRRQQGSQKTKRNAKNARCIQHAAAEVRADEHKHTAQAKAKARQPPKGQPLGQEHDSGGMLDASRVLGIAFGLLTALLTAFALIMVRSLNRTESPGAIALYFVVAAMIGGLVTLPMGWAPLDVPSLSQLVFAGLFGGFAHIALTLSFRFAEASRLAPFEYIALLWPILADLLIFDLALSTGFLLALPLVLSGAAIAAAERTDAGRPKQNT